MYISLLHHPYVLFEDNDIKVFDLFFSSPMNEVWSDLMTWGRAGQSWADSYEKK